jgi:excisionase family DNA binding protein
MDTLTPEFSFTSELPQRKTRLGLIGQITKFFEETEGGAIPIPLAAKMVRRNPETIRRWVSNGKLKAFRTGSTVLVSINGLEALLDEPVDKGGRPRKE